MKEQDDFDPRLDVLEQLIRCQIMLIDIYISELSTATRCKETAERALRQVGQIAHLNELLLTTARKHG